MNNIYRILYLPIAACIFFTCTHGPLSKIKHILGHNTNLNNYKRVDIILSIFSDNNGIKLEIYNRVMTEKYSNTYKWSILLNNPWVKEGVFIYFIYKYMKMKRQRIKMCGTKLLQILEGNL